MNRARRTALTATIAAAVIGGASAVVAASAAEPTSTPTSTPTPTASAASSTTSPVEAHLRDSISSLEDEIAAMKRLASRTTDETLTTASPRATRTSDGPGHDGTEDAGVHQNRGGDDDADEADEADEAEEAEDADHADEPDETDEPDEHHESGHDD